MRTLLFLLACFFSVECSALSRKGPIPSKENSIAPRLQWTANNGYCGEVCLISAGLYYGQYMSQYTARALATEGASQTQGQLLLGVNAMSAANAMHLNAVEWDSGTTNDFLNWVKEQSLMGYPVAIGLYANQFLFYQDPNPMAGDIEYDHIAMVFGITESDVLRGHMHFITDALIFSDNGLWAPKKTPIYVFKYGFERCQADRIKANAAESGVYSIPTGVPNYGIAITGIVDFNKETFPVRIITNVNNETPPMINGSDAAPPPSPIVLTITVSNLKPGINYVLYRYNNVESVPDSDFNGHKSQASSAKTFSIQSGTTFTMTETIQSNETAIYRAVIAP